MLDDKQTIEYIRSAKAGDGTAKEQLLEHNVSLIKCIVKRYLGKGVEYDDLFHENYSDHGLAYRLGAGVQYAVSENTTFRAMYHHSWINGSHLDALGEFTVGVRYAF